MYVMHKAFAETLKWLRKRKGLSQEELGFEAGLHRTYISQLERGHKSPSLDTLWKLSNVLEISPSDILSMVQKRLADEPDNK